MNNTEEEIEETDYSGLIDKVAPKLKCAYEKKTGVDLEKTLYAFNVIKKTLRDAKNDRLISTAWMVVTITIVIIVFLLNIEHTPNGRMNFVVGLVIGSVITLVCSFFKDGNKIAKLEESKNHHRWILDKFSMAVRSICLNSSDYINLVYLTPNGVTNNLVEMAIGKQNAEGFQRIVEHPDSPDNPLAKNEARGNVFLAQLSLQNAIYRLETEFGLKFEEKHIFKLATRRMGKTPTEPLRGFPASPEPQRGLAAEATLVFE